MKGLVNDCWKDGTDSKVFGVFYFILEKIHTVGGRLFKGNFIGKLRVHIFILQVLSVSFVWQGIKLIMQR